MEEKGFIQGKIKISDSRIFVLFQLVHIQYFRRRSALNFHPSPAAHCWNLNSLQPLGAPLDVQFWFYVSYGAPATPSTGDVDAAAE